MILEHPASAPTRARTWRDGDNLPVMVEVARGDLVMGESEGDKFADDTERPAHRVGFAEKFALAKFPVTVGEFRQYRSDHATQEPDSLPAVQVSWDDAAAFCEWLTAETGRDYRLPSEAEWEFACRAGSRGPFASGNSLTLGDANFLYDENGERIGAGRRAPVGSYRANRFGFHDLHGNVCEWVADAWHTSYMGAPDDGRAWIETGARRVVRGGAWDYLPRLLRSSWRDWRFANQRFDNVGFRVATGDLRDIPGA